MSQNPRMVWKGPEKPHLIPALSHQQEYFPLDQVAPNPHPAFNTSRNEPATISHPLQQPPILLTRCGLAPISVGEEQGSVTPSLQFPFPCCPSRWHQPLLCPFSSPTLQQLSCSEPPHATHNWARGCDNPRGPFLIHKTRGYFCA